MEWMDQFLTTAKKAWSTLFIPVLGQNTEGYFSKSFLLVMVV
jgi:hypothetical protein